MGQHAYRRWNRSRPSAPREGMKRILFLVVGVALVVAAPARAQAPTSTTSSSGRARPTSRRRPTRSPRDCSPRASRRCSATPTGPRRERPVQRDGVPEPAGGQPLVLLRPERQREPRAPGRGTATASTSSTPSAASACSTCAGSSTSPRARPATRRTPRRSGATAAKYYGFGYRYVLPQIGAWVNAAGPGQRRRLHVRRRRRAEVLVDRPRPRGGEARHERVLRLGRVRPRRPLAAGRRRSAARRGRPRARRRGPAAARPQRAGRGDQRRHRGT